MVNTQAERKTFIENQSNAYKLIRIVIRCLRWKTCLRQSKNLPITAAEVKIAERSLIIFQQRQLFQEELSLLRKNAQLPRRHWMCALTPYIDPKDGLLRDGGRINNSKIEADARNPILPTKCHLVDLIIRKTHLEMGHCGNALLGRTVREQFWIPAMNSRIKKCMNSCTTCVRWRASLVQLIMGQLPSVRVTPAPIFSNVGVDLCGPFDIKTAQTNDFNKHGV